MGVCAHVRVCLCVGGVCCLATKGHVLWPQFLLIWEVN